MTQIPLQARFKQDIVRLRFGTGAYTRGLYVDGAVTATAYKASVQPFKDSGSEVLQRLREGDRTKKLIVIYTYPGTLRTMSEKPNNTRADLVYYEGEVYEVQKTNLWKGQILSHDEVWAVEFDPGELYPGEVPRDVSNVAVDGETISIYGLGSYLTGDPETAFTFYVDDVEITVTSDGIVGDYLDVVQFTADAVIYETSLVTYDYDGTLVSILTGQTTSVTGGSIDNRSTQINKTALAQAISDAGLLVEGDYTSESWAVLAAAVAAGQIVYDDLSATQSEVDAAAVDINDAIDALVLAPVSCYYGFNGYSQLVMSNDYRTGSRTLTSGTHYGLIAYPSTPLMVDFTTGIKVVGFLADMPSLPAGSSIMQIGFTNSATTWTTWSLDAVTQYDEGYGAYFAGLNCGDGSSIYTPISSWPALLCAQFDAANSTATLFVNGVRVGSVSYTPLSRRMQMKQTQYGISGGSIGLVVSGTIVTDAADIGPGEYDTGATDICGTPIPLPP